MISFVDAVRKVTTDFVGRMDATQQVMSKEKSALSIYNTEEQKKRLAEFEGIAGQLTEKAKAAAFEKLTTIIERARSFFSVAVTEIDVAEITKLEKIFEIGTPSDFIIDTLINACSGSYWALCFMAEKLNDGTAAGALHAPLRPDVQAYLLVIDEIEAACNSFITTYNGPHTLTQPDNGAAQALLLLGGDTWENWRGRLDSIAPAFATDVTILQGALTANERVLLNTLIQPGRSEADVAARVVKLAGDNKKYESLFLRSQYAPIVAAWLDKKAAEELQKTAAYTPFEKAVK
uniref:Uncharacterized protein n=1 Tax=Siphoviridae sp. ctTwu10 TaxID=2825525 RepID=A0A8S5P6L7_9CAUD|nr:MAG TPA: hypothetical protein [Siphoviridae sp. ctTwu10]